MFDVGSRRFPPPGFPACDERDTVGLFLRRDKSKYVNTTIANRIINPTGRVPDLDIDVLNVAYVSKNRCGAIRCRSVALKGRAKMASWRHVFRTLRLADEPVFVPYVPGNSSTKYLRPPTPPQPPSQISSVCFHSGSKRAASMKTKRSKRSYSQ